MFGIESTFLSYYLLGTAFVFGAIIGSFLNVVIYRFHTGKSLNGHSHCLSCQHRLRWYELLPVLSYVVLRGRCRSCGSYIPLRYVVVELATAIGFCVIAAHGGSLLVMALTAVLYALLVLVVVYDIYHYIIPNELVIALAVVAVALYGALHMGAFELMHIGSSVLAAMLAAGFFGVLWYVSDGRWIGFGDAKLAAPLGFLVGIGGVFSFLVLSFWIGAIISVILLSVQYLLKRGQVHLRFLRAPITMKSELPFAPFLIAGFILSFFYGMDVLNILTYVLI